ncbi:MAG TPA: hypothetical protein CFH84_00420 [Sulfurimonas sp. UBA12504]|nr:MAG: hypothetical protein A2019_07095 [Sulfurimonas sp. GWF2_37_8]DAB31073.1 MAG TPA: hypothetical protein CFH84_00420 [Sulfurimonas sp. UBA12504]
MSKFYLFLWLRWLFLVTFYSLFLASALAAFITFFIYLSEGMPPLSSEIGKALFAIAKFWFPLTWSLALLLALFASVKYFFNTCTAGYVLKLQSCQTQEFIEVIGYGDLVKVWRKWFMLLIWIVAAQMIIALAFTSVFSDFESVFVWFDIYWLFGFILVAGYFALIVLTNRCTRVKIKQC